MRKITTILLILVSFSASAQWKKYYDLKQFDSLRIGDSVINMMKIALWGGNLQKITDQGNTTTNSIFASSLIGGSGQSFTPSYMKIMSASAGEGIAVGAMAGYRGIYIYADTTISSPFLPLYKIDAYDFKNSTALPVQIGGNGGEVRLYGTPKLLGFTGNGTQLLGVNNSGVMVSGSAAIPIANATDVGGVTCCGTGLSINATTGLISSTGGGGGGDVYLANANVFTNVQTISQSAPNLQFVSGGFAHPFTFGGALSGDLAGRFIANSGAALVAQGFSNAASMPGFRMQGYVGSTTPTVAPFIFESFKSDGGTDRAALGSSEVAFNFFNSGYDGGGTSLLSITGNGHGRFAGLVESASGGFKFPDGTTQTTAATGYTLPTASATVLGGVKVGTGLSIDGSSVLSVTGTASTGEFILDETSQNYTVSTGNGLIQNLIYDFSGGGGTFTLPTGSGADKMTLYVSNTTTGTLTFSQTLWSNSSTSTTTMSGGGAYKLIYNNTASKWYVIVL
jgi:hypothetical protein